MNNKIYTGKIFTNTAFQDCIHICMDYISDKCTTANNCDYYLGEITDVMHFNYLNGCYHAIKRLAKTNIFKDAIGEVVKITDEYIEYKPLSK